VTLDEARRAVGSGVVYVPHLGGLREDGVITSVNADYVFVRYRGDQTSKATPPECLTLLADS
jgi:replicative DNA helicase